MKYYVTADVHGYCSLLRSALTEAGFFRDAEPHKLLILCDLFDRGKEAAAMQEFILEQMEADSVILIRGNHEDLYVSLVNEDEGCARTHHIHNGTYDTALQLTGYDRVLARRLNTRFAAAGRETPYYRRIIPAMRDFFETEHYIFAHGWIPFVDERGVYRYGPDWRGAPEAEWVRARWTNGMDAAGICPEGKTVVCGHWHASYGHAKYEHKGSEFGPDADHTPYYGSGIIAMDACTALSGKVNVLLLED